MVKDTVTGRFLVREGALSLTLLSAADVGVGGLVGSVGVGGVGEFACSPVPVRLTVTGEADALARGIDSCALRSPLAAGENRTSMVQVLPAVTVCSEQPS